MKEHDMEGKEGAREPESDWKKARTESLIWSIWAIRDLEYVSVGCGTDDEDVPHSASPL